MIEEEKYTDETSIKMKLEKQLRLAGYIATAMVISTNFINVWVNRVTYLEKEMVYQTEADKRRLENAIKELEYEITIENLTTELEICQKPLGDY